MKKSVSLIPSYATVCLNYSVAPSRLLPSYPQQRALCLTRGYATHHDTPPQARDGKTSSSSKLDSHFWPVAKPPRSVPTPYEILQVEPKAKYIKSARFYELVKLYHPDKHDHPTISQELSISKSVRLERYRLVVSAHALLSDPEKRKAYDLYGAGWAGAKSLFPPPDFNMSQEARDACMHNATWQDWENWYDKFNPPKPGEPPRKPQTPIFTSNTAFISLVGILAALAGIGQATRASETSKSYIIMVDAASNKAKGVVNHVQQTKQGLNREERIDYFLRDRDPVAYADEETRKLALNPDAAASVEMKPNEDLKRRYR
jgi:curved DNA-binding protein CbpA